MLKKWLPLSYHIKAFLLFEDWTVCYTLFVDEQRLFRAVRDVLVNKLFEMAEKANGEGRLRLRAKLLSLAEFLA